MATYITVVCPQCNNRMKASSDYIGKKGRCPSCKALVEITGGGDGISVAPTYPTTETRLPAAVQARASSTDPPAWLSGMFGVAATLILYAFFFALRNTALGALFVHRGPIPYAVVLVTCWGLAVLVLKFFAVRRQQSYAELELDLIPLEIGLQITPSNVDQFLAHLAGLAAATRGSILGRRIQQALEHFKARHNVPEVQEYLSTQAEIDASAVDSGYTLLRVFIWAVPILGFIGTVMGISEAVSGLSASLDSGQTIMAGLGGVTGGLATAFDTTLIALAMAILLLFPTESLKKIEYAMLDRIEAFTNESLLRRLTDESPRLNSDDLPEIVRDTLESAFQEHQRWLAEWQTQVGDLGRAIGADFEQAVERIQQSLPQVDEDRIVKLHEATRLLSEIFSGLTDVTDSFHRTEKQLARQFEELFGNVQELSTTVSKATQAGSELIEQQKTMWSELERTDLSRAMSGLQLEIKQLTGKIDAATARDQDAGPPLEPIEDAPARARSPRKEGGLLRIFRRS